MSTNIYRNFGIAAIAAVLVTVSQTAAANLTIDANYYGFTSDQVNTLKAAIAQFESTYTNNVTVNINFHAVNYGLGGSESYGAYDSYQSIYQSLSSNATSTLQKQGVASLPNGTTDPVLGQQTVFITSGDEKALGLISGSSTNLDGDIYLNTGLCFTNAQGPQANLYMLQSVAQHEIDEVMGGGGAGSDIGYSGPVGMLDLYRYSAPGVRSYTTDPSATAYLSADGGKTVINYFNQSGGGSDYGDWLSGSTPHVQDAYGTPGVNVAYGTDETDMMQLIGWNTPAAVPEPSSIALFAVAGLGLVLRRRK